MNMNSYVRKQTHFKIQFYYTAGVQTEKWFFSESGASLRKWPQTKETLIRGKYEIIGSAGCTLVLRTHCWVVDTAFGMNVLSHVWWWWKKSFQINFEINCVIKATVNGEDLFIFTLYQQTRNWWLYGCWLQLKTNLHMSRLKGSLGDGPIWKRFFINITA